MVKQKSNKVNLFDIFVILFVSLLCLIVAIAYQNKPYLGSKNTIVTVEVTDDETISRVEKELQSTAELFYSGTKYPVKQISYQITNNESNDKTLRINLSGLGEIKEGDSIFNGQRIFLNQKVELRSDYFVQGYVVDYRYE